MLQVPYITFCVVLFQQNQEHCFFFVCLELLRTPNFERKGNSYFGKLLRLPTAKSISEITKLYLVAYYCEEVELAALGVHLHDRSISRVNPQ